MAAFAPLILTTQASSASFAVTPRGSLRTDTDAVIPNVVEHARSGPRRQGLSSATVKRMRHPPRKQKPTRKCVVGSTAALSSLFIRRSRPVEEAELELPRQNDHNVLQTPLRECSAPMMTDSLPQSVPHSWSPPACPHVSVSVQPHQTSCNSANKPRRVKVEGALPLVGGAAATAAAAAASCCCCCVAAPAQPEQAEHWPPAVTDEPSATYHLHLTFSLSMRPVNLRALPQ